MFLPYPIKAPSYPFSFPLRGFLFLCVYFPIRVSFRVSEDKIRGNKNCFSCPTYVCLVIIRSILIFCYFPMLCFSAVSPYCFSLCVMFLHCLLLWMLCFSLICPFFCPLWGFLCFYVQLFVLVFFVALRRKKWVLCCACVVYIRKRADETFVCPIRPMSLACYFLCRNDVVLLCGLSVLTFPVTVGVMLS